MINFTSLINLIIRQKCFSKDISVKLTCSETNWQQNNVKIGQLKKLEVIFFTVNKNLIYNNYEIDFYFWY